ASYRGARKAWVLPPALVEGLQTLSRDEGVTMFMTLLAGFQALLHRYTGQDDIVVGSPIANRTRREVEGLIGFFVNSLVLRTDGSGAPTVRALRRGVREGAGGASPHEDAPLGRRGEARPRERQLGQTPLFRVAFARQPTPGKAGAPQASLPLEFEVTA